MILCIVEPELPSATVVVADPHVGIVDEVFILHAFFCDSFTEPRRDRTGTCLTNCDQETDDNDCCESEGCIEFHRE